PRSQSRITPSGPAVASALPSGAKARQAAPWPSAPIDPSRTPAADQTVTPRSAPTTSRAPSGANRTHETAPLPARRRARGVREETSQRVTDPSRWPDAIVRPSRANATERTASPGPLSTPTARPVFASSNRTTPSAVPSAQVAPSGETASGSPAAVTDPFGFAGVAIAE